MKNKKKYLYGIIALLAWFTMSVPVFALPNPSSSNPVSIKVKKIGTVSLGADASAGQGIEVTDKYIVITESKSNNSNATTNSVQVVNKADLSVYRTITADDLGHGNDVAYDSSKNELYFLNGGDPTYRVYDSNTLAFKRNVTIPNFTSGTSLSYDSNNKKLYIAQYSQRLCYVYDKNMNSLLTFDVGPYTGYESQSFEFYDNNLYFTVINEATSANSYSYAPAYIYVFDQTGNVVRVITTNGSGNRRELEGFAVDETTGKIYFLYNNWDYNQNGNNGTTPIEIWTTADDETVKIRLNVNGGSLSSDHGGTVGISDNYITIDGNTTVMTMKHGDATPDYGLPDYNNPTQINIEKTGYHAASGKEWKLTSGKTYHQNQVYYSKDLCNPLMSNCVVDLYVNWTPNQYTIAFDGNGGTGSVSSLQATYDEAVTLSRNKFTKMGYGFTGWNTKADGSGTPYEAGAEVANLTSKDGEIITLYAQWAKKNVVSITVVDNLKTKYEIGTDEIDLAQILLGVEYDNGDYEEFSAEELGATVTSFNSSKLGKQTIEISFDGQTVSTTIEIVEKGSITDPTSTDQSIVSPNTSVFTNPMHILIGIFFSLLGVSIILYMYNQKKKTY